MLYDDLKNEIQEMAQLVFGMSYLSLKALDGNVGAWQRLKKISQDQINSMHQGWISEYTINIIDESCEADPLKVDEEIKLRSDVLFYLLYGYSRGLFDKKDLKKFVDGLRELGILHGDLNDARVYAIDLLKTINGARK